MGPTMIQVFLVAAMLCCLAASIGSWRYAIDPGRWHWGLGWFGLALFFATLVFGGKS